MIFEGIIHDQQPDINNKQPETFIISPSEAWTGTDWRGPLIINGGLFNQV